MDDVQREAERTGEPDTTDPEAVEEGSGEAAGTPEPARSRTPTAEFRVPPRKEPDAREPDTQEPDAREPDTTEVPDVAVGEAAETATDEDQADEDRADETDGAGEQAEAVSGQAQAAADEVREEPEDPEDPEDASLTRPDIALPRRPRPAPPAAPEQEPEAEDDTPGPAGSGPAPRPSPNPTIVDRMPVVKPAGPRPPAQDDPEQGAPEEAAEAAAPAEPSPQRTVIDRPRRLRPEPEDQVWEVRAPDAPASAPAESAHVAPPLPPRPVRPPEDEVWHVPAPQESAPPDTRSSGAWAVPWENGAPIAQAPPPMPVDVEPRKKRRWPLVTLLMVLVLLVGAVTGQLLRPLPDPTVELTLSASSHTFAGTAPTLPWSGQGQSVVYVDGLGLMGSSGGAAPTPTASVAKVMTAYVYLKEHPLAAGEPGPVLTVSPQAAAQIPARKRRGESLLGVTAGQRLTQRKALEALMIISANDVAHELARWDAGSGPAFVAKMNAAAKALGMDATRYTDPSGYHSGTVSTAADQVKLLRAAMRLPAFEEIVNKRAYVPDDGGPARPGGNILLGQYGVVGGKTGYTDAAGGNYVFAARTAVSGVPTLILGAVMGQRSSSAMAAISAGQQLVAAAGGALTATTLAPAGARVARIEDGLGGRTPLRAASAVTVVGWPGLTVPVRVLGDPPAEGGAGERVATVRAGAARVPLELDRTLAEPDLVKRLTRLR
ncbi:D-alanyl-D-alanine carboxypeptidase [Spirillospora albida]|uniref:D-alanyl-D-alanine carboxypeptidase n=1 Tax=Spirillospora albida TaxID=58123 RepID=UPI000A65A2DF|nr:hypothetical protein [Spirillospora albida]